MAHRRWIADAIRHPGAFTRKARNAGMSVDEFAHWATRHGSRASTRTKRQAALYFELRRLRRRRR